MACATPLSTATPLGQRALELGADVVVASDTKALSGHRDLVCDHASRADQELAERGGRGAASGAVPSPFETWLAHRGLGALDPRLARQAQNTAALAGRAVLRFELGCEAAAGRFLAASSLVASANQLRRAEDEPGPARPLG